MLAGVELVEDDRLGEGMARLLLEPRQLDVGRLVAPQQHLHKTNVVLEIKSIFKYPDYVTMLRKYREGRREEAEELQGVPEPEILFPCFLIPMTDIHTCQ